MNFKPTLLKIIVSLLAGFFVDYLLASVASSIKVVCDEVVASCPQPSSWYQFALDPVPLLSGLVVGILIYIIWGLIEKKK